MDFDLNEYLVLQTSQGVKDSQGEFKISADEAARKLARFALPHNYSWIQKLLQATSGWDVPLLDVRQTREATFFTFEPKDDQFFPTKEELLQTLVSTGIGGVDPLQRFCIALRSVVEQLELSFVLGVKPGRGEAYSIYAGVEAGKMTPEKRQSWGQLNSRGFVLAVTHRDANEYFSGALLEMSMPQKRRDLMIAQALEQHAICLPFPVRVDGRVVNDVWHQSEFGFSTTRRPLFLDGEEAKDLQCSLPRTLPVARLSLFHSAQSAAKAAKLREDFQNWFVLRGCEVRGVAEIKGIARPIGSDAEADHEILWVQSGVVIHKEQVKVPCWVCQLLLVINADGLKTDLTGLNLVDSDRRAARLERALQIVTLKLSHEAADCSFYIKESPQASLESLREARISEVTARLPLGLQPFRRIVSLGVGGHHEWRKGRQLRNYENLLKQDLELLLEALKEKRRTLEKSHL